MDEEDMHVCMASKGFVANRLNALVNLNVDTAKVRQMCVVCHYLITQEINLLHLLWNAQKRKRKVSQNRWI